MNKRLSLTLALAAMPLLSGCLSTAASVITAPVRVAGKAVDWTTTSQSEADEKRGRRVRKQEEQVGKLDRQYQKHLRNCRGGDERACDQARDVYNQMQDINPGMRYREP